jgi:hypothetical protein
MLFEGDVTKVVIFFSSDGLATWKKSAPLLGDALVCI